MMRLMLMPIVAVRFEHDGCDVYDSSALGTYLFHDDALRLPTLSTFSRFPSMK